MRHDTVLWEIQRVRCRYRNNAAKIVPVPRFWTHMQQSSGYAILMPARNYGIKYGRPSTVFVYPPISLRGKAPTSVIILKMPFVNNMARDSRPTPNFDLPSEMSNEMGSSDKSLLKKGRRTWLRGEDSGHLKTPEARGTASGPAAAGRAKWALLPETGISEIGGPSRACVPFAEPEQFCNHGPLALQPATAVFIAFCLTSVERRGYL
ncbi:hypothetical protein J6590_027723 [Homalodisca vitripennis]|nr:hypothetical protein J6590_027723 [Homalodisca vitripennis]